MTEKLNALMAMIDRDHALFDTLIDQPAEQLKHSVPCAESSANKDSHCRTHIREMLAKYLTISLRHFEHEHQLMHEIRFPRDFIEAHAIEHDKLLQLVNDAITIMHDGTCITALIETIGEIGRAYRYHRDSVDSILLDHMHLMRPFLK